MLYNTFINHRDLTAALPVVAQVWSLYWKMSHLINTYHRNSLDEFFEERRLSNFHFLLPFLSELEFSSSHLSSGEPMFTGDSNNIIKNKIDIIRLKLE